MVAIATLRDHAAGLTATVPAAATPADLVSAANGAGWVAVTDAGRIVAILDASAADPPLPATSASTRVLLPPLVVLPADLTMTDLVNSAAITLLDLGGPAALLVDRDGAAVGALPVAAVVDHLAGPGYLTAYRHLGPNGPTGDGTWPTGTRLPLARLHCAVAECGYLNELTEYFEDALVACANPEPPRHDLVLGRR